MRCATLHDDGNRRRRQAHRLHLPIGQPERAPKRVSYSAYFSAIDALMSAPMA